MEKDSAHLRDATEADLPAILAILNEAIARTTSIYEYDAFDMDYLEAWWLQHTSNDWPVVALTLDDRVVGFATYGTFRARAAYRTTKEHSVYVLEECRGNGFGKLLLQAIVKRAKQNGVHVLIAGVDAENAISIALHEREGFRIAGRLHEVAYKFDRWLDLVLMEKKL